MRRLILMILFMIALGVGTMRAQDIEYDEIQEPSLQAAMESMRAHQIQYTMYLFYTMNVDTPGFIEQGGYNRRLKDSHRIKMIPFYRWRAGPIIETNKDLDFALEADSRGFFTVRLPGGKEGFTRDGRFVLDSQNRLVMADGLFLVLGERGPITAPEGADITSSVSGMLFANGDPLDRLKIALFTDSGRDKLITLNGSIFILSDPGAERVTGEEKYRVRQGFLEQNNVLKAIIGDVAMLKRSYEGVVKTAKVTSRAMSSTLQIGAP